MTTFVLALCSGYFLAQPEPAFIIAGVASALAGLYSLTLDRGRKRS